MDKRMIENARVKKSIEDAFFTLLKEKNFSEITVTDLVKKSGVARTSYYRNFDSKEDIIKEYIQRLREEIDSAFENSVKIFGEKMNIQTLTIHISYYLKEMHNILLLYENGFGTLMLDETNHYIEEAYGDMSCSSIERYRLYFTSGAIFNTMIQWLKTGAKEAPGEIAQIMMGMLAEIGMNIPKDCLIDR
ncbi:MAG: TetR/AcrR family transcriptional regulator [Fusicatenibacter sp.]|nr:TetR/AcrR family transcriptional regulator [Lachnospiraceae bacterium]MDY2937737.1 TetR/AcrR family transcriptional regulator [Fusicatenibacter sp.]